MARLIGVKFMAKCWEVQNTRDLADTKKRGKWSILEILG